MSFNLQDLSFGITPQESEVKLDDVLNILPTSDGRVNNYKGGTVIINSDRLILNSKVDYMMLCGREGVMITSPKTIHLDCDEDIHIFSNSEVYIGLPNKGDPYDFDKEPKPKNKAQATANSKYEPLVLGLKLVNLLEDLLVLVKNASVITPSGKGFMSAETMYGLACLQARLPEMLSTYAFIDGITHEGVDPEPPAPAGLSQPAANTITQGSPGSATTSTQTTGAGSNPNNQSSGTAQNPQSIAVNNVNNGTLPVAADSGKSNPTAPSTNTDGAPPTNSTGWVPGTTVITGTEYSTNGQESIVWSVKKADLINNYTGTYAKPNTGIPVTWSDADLNRVILEIKQAARGELP